MRRYYLHRIHTDNHLANLERNRNTRYSVRSLGRLYSCRHSGQGQDFPLAIGNDTQLLSGNDQISPEKLTEQGIIEYVGLAKSGEWQIHTTKNRESL